MKIAKFCLPVAFVLMLMSCAKKEGTNDVSPNEQNSTSEKDIAQLLSTFPMNSIEDLIESISQQDLADLLSKGETATWILTKEKTNEITITNKSAADNIAVFTFFSSDGKGLAVQQFNGQNAVTNLYEFSDEAEQKWKPIALPELKLKEFIVEEAENVTDYDESSPYLEIAFAKDTMIYSINRWRLGLEAKDMYKEGLEKNYIKYQHLFIWKGNGFTQRNRIDPNYAKLYTMEASVFDDEFLNPSDGPGPLEWTCGYGMSIKASSELAPQGSSNYKAVNMFSSDTKTAWSEGDAGDGTGQWIEFTLKEDFHFGFNYIIQNGFAKSLNLWKANNRVKKFTVHVNDKPFATVLLQDSDKYQSFNIKPNWINPVGDLNVGDRVKFVIDEIYKGEKYNDTVITYFEPTGECN
jgi:hypothetical protein